MTAPLNRRDALAVLGSGAAVATVSGAALAVVEGRPDAELIRLGRQWTEALAEAHRLTRELTRIAESVTGDLGAIVSIVTARDPLNQAKAYIAFTEAEIVDHVSTLGAEARASSDKLIAELRQKKAGAKAELDRRGHARVETATNAAWERVDDIEAQIFNTPAETAAGLVVKLEIALHQSQDADMFGRPFADQDWGTKAIWRTLDDAKRMAGRAS